MLSATLRYVCLALMLICNALFFWDVEARTDALSTLAFGEASPQPAKTRITQTQMEQTNSYTFSNPARLSHSQD